MRSKCRTSAYLAHKDEVLERFGYACASCGSKDDLEIHHIVPLALGGTDRITNLIPLCHRCHKTAHCGQEMSRYSPKKPSGRKCNLSEEEAEAVLDRYFGGQIGTIELKELFGWSKSYKISESPQFRKYVTDRKICQYRNKIDTMRHYGYAMNPGAETGYVIYANGTKKTLYLE